MDWFEDMHSDVCIFPRDMARHGATWRGMARDGAGWRGMARDGGGGAGSLRWDSLHGSVVTSVYEGATSDGMNEQGLVANVLYLTESDVSDDQRSAISDQRSAVVASAWAQSVLDRFGSVEEAVAELAAERFRVVSASTHGRVGTVHLAISVPPGDSAIFEYISGRLVVHHGRQYQVMTNSPVFSEQLPLNDYWAQIGGTTMLPGTNRSADRFVGASFHINAARQSADPREAAAAVFSVMRSVSVPRGISAPEQPDISTTIWRTVSDQEHRIDHFEDTACPSLLWLRLEDIDFTPASGIRKLGLPSHPELGGDRTHALMPATPCAFLASP